MPNPKRRPRRKRRSNKSAKRRSRRNSARGKRWRGNERGKRLRGIRSAREEDASARGGGRRTRLGQIGCLLCRPNTAGNKLRCVVLVPFPPIALTDHQPQFPPAARAHTHTHTHTGLPRIGRPSPDPTSHLSNATSPLSRRIATPLDPPRAPERLPTRRRLVAEPDPKDSRFRRRGTSPPLATTAAAAAATGLGRRGGL